ncbi:hypothetical protein MGWOODY_Tha799 [hydrothermal vent metagenome]|uniref:Uncharacterized protein n=1 Tax=hydrothermal vent metagenome TaxID=652676 RepID=A0A160TBR7_9ZZZZ
MKLLELYMYYSMYNYLRQRLQNTYTHFEVLIQHYEAM